MEAQMQDAMELVDHSQPGSGLGTGPAAKGALLSALITENCATLEERFGAARWQGPVRLEGHPAGRMLAVPGFDRGLVARGLSLFGGSALNPWQGKSFRPVSEREGLGTNRIRVAGLRFTAFLFKTYETASVVDGQPALAIDYDTPHTPGYARATYDELRPVAPGLFLGRGMKRITGRSPKLLVWFALDLNRPDRPCLIAG
jgi:hypothetical protein